jgi:hypothetical protein
MTWNFPSEVTAGRYDYYFRRLYIDVESTTVAEYQLGIQ